MITNCGGEAKTHGSKLRQFLSLESIKPFVNKELAMAAFRLSPCRPSLHRVCRVRQQRDFSQRSDLQVVYHPFARRWLARPPERRSRQSASTIILLIDTPHTPDSSARCYCAEWSQSACRLHLSICPHCNQHFQKIHGVVCLRRAWSAL
jgi:hypothetical protein